MNKEIIWNTFSYLILCMYISNKTRPEGQTSHMTYSNKTMNIVSSLAVNFTVIEQSYIKHVKFLLLVFCPTWG